MAAAVTIPFDVAAIVLALAGVAKLRSPAVAARSLTTLGLPSSSTLVRCAAGFEVALAVGCLVRPDAVLSWALASVYGFFAVLAATLARRQSACGCFGDRDTPASLWQSTLSAAFAVAALAAAITGRHEAGWVLARPPMTAAVAVLGIAGAAYAAVLAYTELPRAWTAWGGR